MIGYSVFVALGMLAAFFLKRTEDRRLGYRARPGYAYVAAGAVMGAALGSKLGMLLYIPFASWKTLWPGLYHLHFDGKTILGGIAGGFLGVEIAKKLAGVTGSTGDAFVLPIAVGQGVGRFGCTIAGCCYGAPTQVPWAVWVHGAYRHPAPLYDALACFCLGGLAIAVRDRITIPGRTFRWFLVVYAVIRVGLDPFRGDERVMAGPLSLPQWFCIIGATALVLSMTGPRLRNAHSAYIRRSE